MKFIHIADVHLGAKPDSEYPWGNLREKEIQESFHDLILICEKENIDLLLIAGDLFHRQPLLRELKNLNYQFEKIPQTKVVIIAGNHDYIGPRSHYGDFIWNSNVTMLNGEQMGKVYFPELDTEVYGFSYHHRNIMEERLAGVKPDENNHYHILLAHGGDEKNIPMDQEAVKNLGFDYIALGHIHKPMILSERCAYAGAFEPLDKSEIGPHGYMEGELNEKKLTLKLVPHSIRRYEWIEMGVTPEFSANVIYEKLKEKIEEHGSHNIFRIHLKGVKSVGLSVDYETIRILGNVIEIIDEMVPDYNFETLKEENQENIIGLYIDKIHESNTEEEVKRKALYYGLEALLGAKR